MKILRFISLGLLTTAACACLRGGVVYALDVPPPPSKTAILDQAGIIDDVAEASLSQKLIDYKAKTGNEIAVLTIKSLQGEDDFDYSFRVAQSWGIGSKEANNGALLFVALEDRKLRIQVGRGLEPYLTDLQSSLIIREKITPAFKQSNYTAGITSGVESMIAVIGGERLSEPKKPRISGGAIEFFLFAGFFTVAYLASFLARSKSWWAGGAIGSVPGIILFFTAAALVASVVFILGLLLGLLFDYLISKNYRARTAAGDSTGFWSSGGGFFGGTGGSSGGGGGFGGFSGGSFGGGGSGGSW